MTQQHQASRATRRPSGLTDLSGSATRDISAGLNGLLADVFALNMKQGLSLASEWPAFSRLSPSPGQQGDQIFAMTDPIAERVRKLGATLRSTGRIAVWSVKLSQTLSSQ
jgi:starvation-inducible DNA-binding protein